eukprot:6431959-Amphidinium_carterae.1
MVERCSLRMDSLVPAASMRASMASFNIVLSSSTQAEQRLFQETLPQTSPPLTGGEKNTENKGISNDL